MEKRANMPAEERAAKNAAVCKSVLASATYRFADTLLLYYPRADEVDVLPIARAALEAGKKVAFPKCHPADKSMDFHFVSSVDDFEKGEYDIMEPVNSLGIYNKENSLRDNCICIVPAVVYDKKGYRIGYGGGYYDRYLSGALISEKKVAVSGNVITAKGMGVALEFALELTKALYGKEKADEVASSVMAK